MTTYSGLLAAGALALALGSTLPAAPAMARGDDGVVRSSGSCTGGGTWKLKAKHDDGRVEVEFQVDTNRAGQTWTVRVTDNGTRVVARNATTRAPSGSFSIEKRIANRAGTDVVRARATRGDRVCSGTVRV